MSTGDDDYRNGIRDSRLKEHENDIKELKEDHEKMKIKISVLSAWQNRAVGYATAIATVVTVAVQWLIRKYL